MRVSRQLNTGDFVIRHNRDDDIWECWLVGAAAPYDAIVGTGKFPVRAMAAWNVLANEAKRAEKEVKEEPEPKRRGWWRQ